MVREAPGSLTVKILVLVIAGQITCIVDAVAKGAVDRGGFVEIRPKAVAIDEPVCIAGAVHVLPDDLVAVVNSRCESGPIGPCSGIVERGPVAAALDEAVGMIAVVGEITDHYAGLVDAVCIGLATHAQRHRIVECGPDATAVKKSVITTIVIVSDDLA